MNKETLIKQLTSQKVKDYSFTIGFFLAFSFFLLFAIRPNLLAVVTLREEVMQLRELNLQYEENISKIIQLQTAIEQNRTSLTLLSEALPAKPEVHKVIDDVKKSASASGMPISTIEITDVNLIHDASASATAQFTISIEANTDFTQARRFIDLLFAQRRLKTIENLSIIKAENASSTSAKLLISLDIDGYYL